MSTVCRVRCNVVLAIFAAAWCASAGAATRTWNGPAAGDWFQAGNWNPNDAYPAAGDAVVVNAGSILLTNATAMLDSFAITNATLLFTNLNTVLSATNIYVATF